MANEIIAYRQRPIHAQLAKNLKIVAWVLTAVVLTLVGLMQRVSIDLGFDTSFLPPFHAAVNAAAAATLIIALIFIKLGKVTAHRNTILVAMALSVVFLLSYVLYHITNEPVRYQGEGAIKLIYLSLLFSHIILAAVSLPFILFAFITGITNNFNSHLKLVKWVFPMWLYVAITGPICYLMLRPFY